MMILLSANLPSRTTSMTIPQTLMGLPVAGTPRNSPRCVPFILKRLSTFSPSAICSSIVSEGRRRHRRRRKSLASSPRARGLVRETECVRQSLRLRVHRSPRGSSRDHLFGEPLHKLLILLGHGAYLRRLRCFLKPAAILRRATPHRDERADHRRAGSLGRELVTA